MMTVNDCHQNVSVICFFEIIITDLDDIEQSPTISSTTILQLYEYGRILGYQKCSQYRPISLLFNMAEGGGGVYLQLHYYKA